MAADVVVSVTGSMPGRGIRPISIVDVSQEHHILIVSRLPPGPIQPFKGLVFINKKFF